MNELSCCGLCRYRTYIESGISEGESLLRCVLSEALESPNGRMVSTLEIPFEYVVFHTARVGVLKWIRSVMAEWIRLGFRPSLPALKDRILEAVIEDPYPGGITILRSRHAILVSELSVLTDEFEVRSSIGNAPPTERLF